LPSAAITARPHSPICPQSPAGVAAYSAPTWSGVIAPAGVPRPIVDRINAAINRAIQSQAMRQFQATIGDEPAGGTPEEFAALIAADSQKWGEVIKRAGIRLE
jgi:tripartite-type tricarboxylate transporter receptor subunit TctC